MEGMVLAMEDGLDAVTSVRMGSQVRKSFFGSLANQLKTVFTTLNREGLYLQGRRRHDVDQGSFKAIITNAT